MADLTVIVPLYNTEQYIEQCIESIMNQTKQDISILIVDDGSTDSGPRICEKLALTDPRIRIIHQENCGPLRARFNGLRECETEYVTFVDADDFILENAYALADDAMRRHVDLIQFEIARYYGDRNYKTEPCVAEAGYYDRERIERDIYPKAVWDFENRSPGMECSQCVRIVKKALALAEFEKFGDRRIHLGEDCIISFPLYMRIQDMEVIPVCYYMHRQRGAEPAAYIRSDDFFDEAYLVYRYLIEAMCADSDYFRKQIEYYYMCLIRYKKLKYGDTVSEDRFWFPFDKVPYGKKLILYGAGDKGSDYYRQLERLSYYDSLLWVDQRAAVMDDERVQEISAIGKFDADYVVIAIDRKEIRERVKEMLTAEYGMSSDKIVE